MDVNINADCHSQAGFFNNFVDIFVNFNNLRHKDDFFNNLLKQVRNFNDLLLCTENWDYFLLDGRNCLKFGLNNVSNVFFSNESFGFYNFILVDNNLFDLSVSSFDSNNFFFNSRNFNYCLMNDRNLNCSISDLLDNIANFNNNRNFSCEFNNLRHLHNFFTESFDFINFGNFSVYNDKLFNNSWHFNYSVSCLNGWLADFSLNFLKYFTVVGGYFFNLFDNLSYNSLLNSSKNLFDSYFFDFNLNNSLHFLDNLHNFLNFSVHSNNLFNNSIHWNWYLDWNNSGLFNFDDFFNFYD